MKVISFLRNKIVVGVMLFAFVVCGCFVNCDAVVASTDRQNLKVCKVAPQSVNYTSTTYDGLESRNGYISYNCVSDSSVYVFVYGNLWNAGDYYTLSYAFLFVSDSSFSISDFVFHQGSSSDSSKLDSFCTDNGLYFSYYASSFNSSIVPTFDTGYFYNNSSTFLPTTSSYLGGVVDNVWNDIYKLSKGASYSFDSASATYDSDLGYLKDIKYQYVMEKIPTGHKVYYNFNWNTKTSAGIDLTQDGYDVLYYWECYADSVSLLGKAEHYDSLYSDKFLMKEKHSNVFNLLEYAFEGDLFDIYSDICDKQPLACRSFEVTTKLHAVPVYFDGENSYIGSWAHITFDNTMDSKTIQQIIDDELDGNGLEQSYDISVEMPDGTVSNSHHSSSVGVGNTIDEAINNSNNGNSTSLDMETYQNVSNTLNVFISSVKSFNELIVSVLSWLPPWVLAFLISAIVIVCIMIIKRAIF